MRYVTLILMMGLWAVSMAVRPMMRRSEYVPAETKVAVVPVLNLSGETWPEGKEKQAKRGDEEARALFEERGFVLIPEETVRAGLEVLKIDLNDEEQHRREVLYRLGKQTGADLIAFVVITDVDQRRVNKVFVSSTEGKAKMKVWLLDVRNEKPHLSAATIEGSSKSGGWIEVGEKGSSRKQLAVANGLRKGLESFLKPYPIVKKVARTKVG